MSEPTVLEQLVAMTRALGDPALDYAILGEGNTSARIDAETFWVKASGAEMRTVDGSGLVRVRFDRVLALLEAGCPDDEQVRAGLEAAKADPAVPGRPSVETVLHALALQVGDTRFVGHTHPTAVNAVLCSEGAEEALAGRLFPDEIVYCGPAPVFIPYTDPGVPLAVAVRDAVDRYLAGYRQPPRVILMQNHGLIALGRTALEVQNITAMAVKAARVLLGTYALGGPRFLSPEAVARIHTRPDEQYRRREWGGAGRPGRSS
jgi:rhamnose utilization protein RhaD (predicted bifunctional aldolase and dehydrogenase)